MSRVRLFRGRRPRKPTLAVGSLALVAVLAVSCAGHRQFTPDRVHWKDRDDRGIDDLGYRDPSLVWQSIDRSIFDQATELLDLDRNVRKLSGNPSQAANINSYDEVPNSSWFTNRQGLFHLSHEELIRGATTGSGPDTSGPWIVSRPKVLGATPGFWITDARGDKYIIKFDPKGYPDLATAAAVITGRFLYAVGYNVPEEYIVYWRPEQLRIKDSLTFTDRHGILRPFTPADLEAILSRVEHQPDGTIRSLASKLLSNVRGPFSFTGRRTNDSNDWCPHELRRELRGLYVFCSLVNHWDIKDQNTMDVLHIESDGRQYLKHFLLDFGSSLGSAGNRPQDPIHGYANLADTRDAFVSLLTLGLKTWQWEHGGRIEHPTVGYFESEIFHPAKWDPIYPIPPFENRTNRDAYWAAKKVTAFSDDEIRTLVEAGRFTDPEAGRLLTRLLIERRDKIGRYWFARVSPLDYFEFTSAQESITIVFDDLEVRSSFVDPGRTNRRYRCMVEYKGRTVYGPADFTESRCMISGRDLGSLSEAFIPGEGSDSHLYEIAISIVEADGGSRPPVQLSLWYHPEENRYQLVGIEHED